MSEETTHRRRSDRYAPAAPVPPAAVAPTAPKQETAPVHRRAAQTAGAPMTPAALTRPVQGQDGRQPAQPGYPQPVYPTQVRPQGVRPQTVPTPGQRMASRPQTAAPRPVPPPVMERPDAVRPRQDSRKERQRMPGWLIGAMITCVLLIGLCWAGRFFMLHYQQQKAEEARLAYQAVVDAHPVYYQDLIERYAHENNLQPAFVEAIILNESSYRPDAESNVGARGLMQVMEDTAGWIAGKLGDKQYHFDAMYDPETNIRYGTWYLGYLSRLFRGDPVLMAAAYHAGQTTVNRWLADPRYSTDGVTMAPDDLPDGPTKTYARRVTRDYAIYQALLYPSSDGAADSADPAADGTALR